jgi:aminoglycoside phosphotransferase (APT) family kinase protein
MERVGDGREAEIFAWGEGRVLRLLKDPLPGQAEREASAMRAAAAAGAPVPAVDEVVEVDGRAGIVMERIDGLDGLAVLGRQPWRLPAMGRLLGDVHAQLHETTAPGELPGVRDWLGQRIAASELIPRHLGDFALELLEELPDGDALCHADLHPGNVLLGHEGPVVIDWTGVMRGDPMADVAWTRLLLRVARPQPTAPALVRAGARLGGKVLASRYLRAYGRRRPLDLDAAERWEPVLLADRIAKGLESDEPGLTAMLEDYRGATRR